jgi:Ca-activated chloride channel homolog
MRQILLGVILLFITLAAHGGEFWDRLWLNADQRGDALLHRGNAEASAKAYTDPRRKAYAQLQAGDYKDAAETLKNFHDSDSDYNRGNALAHVGDLAGALLSYDAALKLNPNDKDARHNRDLVADAMKRNPQQQQKSDSNKPQKDQGRQGKDSSGQNNGRDKNKAQENSGQTDHQSGSGTDASEQNGQQGKAGEKSAGKNARKNGESQKEQNDNGASEARQQGSDTAQTASQNGAQGRQDAAATRARAVDTENDTAVPAPKSEQQIEEDQWLHSIPDDPGGLLRRKFLIEHMLRQQGAEP